MTAETKYVGIKCPPELFESYLRNRKNKSKVLIDALKVSKIPAIFENLFNKLGEQYPNIAKALYESLNDKDKGDLLGFLERDKESE